MTDALKPCPFCGGDASIERMGTGRVSMIIVCGNCGCSLESSETFLGPRCYWNIRTSPDPRIAALEAECKRLRKDAERYRWLRDNGEEMITADRGMGPSWTYGETLDNKVDAAIKESER